MEKKKIYAFKIRLNEAESARFEAYASQSGVKKYVIVHKALIKYLDEQKVDGVVAIIQGCRKRRPKEEKKDGQNKIG